MLQIFYFGAGFGTGHALTYHERERNLRFTGGPAGDRQYATFGFNGAVFDIGFHTPHNLWEPPARRQGGMKFPGE